MSDEHPTPETDPKKKKPRGLEAPPIHTSLLESPVMKSPALGFKKAEAAHGPVR